MQLYIILCFQVLSSLVLHSGDTATIKLNEKNRKKKKKRKISKKD